MTVNTGVERTATAEVHAAGRPAGACGLGAVLAASIVLLAPLAAAPVAAQQMFVGQVVDEVTGLPMNAVFVTAHGSEGERLGADLTDREGRFRLRAERGSGPYTLRAEHIGYGTAETEPLEPEAGRAVEVTLRLPPAAIALDEIRVVGSSRRCTVEAGEGLRVQELWNEARKALEILAWTEEEELFRFRGRQYERVYAVATGRIEREQMRSIESGGRPPFVGAPAADLLEGGYVRPAAVGDVDYFGPDARVILSREFLDAYCFRLVERGAPGLTGLAFEPVEAREQPDVTGVLWLDEETRELRHLEFQYTRHLLRQEVPEWLHPVFGGRLDFRELPNGAWIVERWRLQMPEFQRRQLAVISDWTPVREAARQIFERRTLRPNVGVAPAYDIPERDRDVVSFLGVREEGGELVAVETDDGLELLTPEVAVLEGVAFDSTRMAPLQGARVELAGTGYRTVADREGVFRLVESTEGRFQVVVRHSRLERLGVDPLTAEVELVRGEARHLELAGPSGATLHARACGMEPGSGPDAVVAGRVRDAGGLFPVEGARIDLTAPDDPDARPLSIRTAEDGTFRVCSLRAGVAYVVAARVYGVVEELDTLRLEPGEVRELDVVPPLRPEGTLRGIVQDAGRGVPVAEATVVIEGEGRPRLRFVSDQAGRFDTTDLPVGPYSLQVDHPAYRTVTREVTVEGDGRVVNVEVRLLPDAIALEPIVVQVEGGRPTFGGLVDVYDRMDRMRQLGIGRVFDRRAIEEASPARVSHLLSGIGGVRGRPLPGSPNLVITLNPRNCPPSYYVDGVRVHLFSGEEHTFSIDERVTPSEVEAVEVYRRSTELPGEFADLNALRCGAVAVWTRRR